MMHYSRICTGIQGHGEAVDQYLKEAIAGFYDDVSLTLADTISGSTAQERLDNVHHVRVQKPATLEWIDVVRHGRKRCHALHFDDYSNPGATHDATTFEVIYNAHEADDFAWASSSEPGDRTSSSSE